MPADRDLAVFYRSLAEMLRAGVVVGGALESCASSLPEAGAAARIVAQGQPLSAAFARFPRVFPSDHVQLLQIAEHSGSLEATLHDLADYATEMDSAQRTVKSGLTLPAFIVHLGAFLAPVSGLVLGHTSLADYLLAALLPLSALWMAVAAGVWFARRAPAEKLDTILRHVPVVNDAWSDLQRWRVAASLRFLARTSLDVPSSLRFAASVCRDAHLAATLRYAATRTARHGTPASTAIDSAGALPSDVIALWRNAEITGTHEAAFARIADRYAQSFRHRVQTLATWLPRIAYLLVAVAMVLQIFRSAGNYLGALAH
ncbi:MAG: type II secretion system F family protein [Verrucomicrobia bacterium]|nr:type II secretion system F family protein [Verrucomicrobiota bacterium]